MVELAGHAFEDLGNYFTIIADWLDAPRVTSLVLMEDARARGFALVARHNRLGFLMRPTAELVALVLDPKARGRGLGRVLLEAAEAEAGRFQAREMWLHTAEDNFRARKFFAMRGYVESGPRRDQRRYPHGQKALEFRRALGE